jgi:3-hydroxyisobutyrate dehydrogenase-like beta-hydroxyacid dehydrogenase
MSEAFTLGEKSGVGQDMVLKLLKDIMPAPSLIAYAEKFVNNAFDGTKGFAIDGGIKDATSASYSRLLTYDAH